MTRASLKLMNVAALAGIVVASGLAEVASAETARKAVVSTCINENDPSDSLELTATIVLAPKRLNDTVLFLFERQFHSDGEYSPFGPVMVRGTDEHGHWVTVQASWPLLKSGSGELITSPGEAEKTYRCRAGASDLR